MVLRVHKEGETRHASLMQCDTAFTTLSYPMQFFIYPICASTKCNLFGHLHALLSWPRVVSRALGCGARRGAACAPQRKCGSRRGSVTRAMGVQSRAIWQVITGLLSASPSLAGQWKTHN